MRVSSAGEQDSDTMGSGPSGSTAAHPAMVWGPSHRGEWAQE